MRARPSILIFSFYLLAFGFLLLTLGSCSFNPPVQGNGVAFIQGEWQQDSVPAKQQLVTYSQSKIRFECDSFYITINTVSKVNNGTDSCMNKGRWTEYIKGRYEQVNDTLHLKGFFRNADGSMKDDKSCFRYGVYEEFYSVKQQGDSALLLSSPSSVLPVKVNLVKHITCVPKPL